MSPPDWAVQAGVRLDLDEFGPRFADLWSSLHERFRKLECWQTYQEPSAKSLAAFAEGDLTGTEKFLREEAEADRPLYRDVQQKGIDFARIRLVQRPFTTYLRFEFVNYRIRENMGETIKILELANEKQLPNDRYFDFLLFDRSAALIHDYGEDGLQRGGWYVSQASVIDRLESIVETARKRAIDLAKFIAMNPGVNPTALPHTI